MLTPKTRIWKNCWLLKKADEITQTVYEREVEKINKQIMERKTALLSEVKTDLMETIEKMREIAKSQISMAPTAEMVNTLQILAMLDEISPEQVSIYAEQMIDCPLAMQRLQQIAKKHEIKIFVDEPEIKLRALDNLEGNLVNFLLNYDGLEEHCPYSVRDMYRYFQPDEKYMGSSTALTDTEKVNERFWNTFVGISSYKVFDDLDSTPGKPKAQYFFSDVAALSNFIKKATTGASGPMVEEIENIILENCPERYGTVLRNYRYSGEMLDLNEE